MFKRITIALISCVMVVIIAFTAFSLIGYNSNYESEKSNLPTDFNELIIEGGCHSYFGDYGMQKGDGNPTIKREEQMDKTVEFIVDSISKMQEK